MKKQTKRDREILNRLSLRALASGIASLAVSAGARKAVDDGLTAAEFRKRLLDTAGRIGKK